MAMLLSSFLIGVSNPVAPQQSQNPIPVVQVTDDQYLGSNSPTFVSDQKVLSGGRGCPEWGTATSSLTRQIQISINNVLGTRLTVDGDYGYVTQNHHAQALSKHGLRGAFNAVCELPSPSKAPVSPPTVVPNPEGEDLNLTDDTIDLTPEMCEVSGLFFLEADDPQCEDPIYSGDRPWPGETGSAKMLNLYKVELTPFVQKYLNYVDLVVGDHPYTDGYGVFDPGGWGWDVDGNAVSGLAWKNTIWVHQDVMAADKVIALNILTHEALHAVEYFNRSCTDASGWREAFDNNEEILADSFIIHQMGRDRTFQTPYIPDGYMPTDAQNAAMDYIVANC